MSQTSKGTLMLLFQAFYRKYTVVLLEEGIEVRQEVGQQLHQLILQFPLHLQGQPQQQEQLLLQEDLVLRLVYK